MAKTRQHSFPEAMGISALVVGLLCLIQIVEWFLPPHFLMRYGILPRTGMGLVGIIFSPLLHANLEHLLANAIPLFILLVLLLTNRHYYPYRTLALIWLASGLGTWLIGRGNRVHLGASAIILGLIAYLIWSGIFMRSWRSVLVAIVVFFIFGGALLGVLPQAGGISWEGHLCGAVAGVWAAKWNHA